MFFWYRFWTSFFLLSSSQMTPKRLPNPSKMLPNAVTLSDVFVFGFRTGPKTVQNGPKGSNSDLFGLRKRHPELKNDPKTTPELRNESKTIHCA